jgi:molecular chaperone GrpE (heat shock protein)
MTMAAAKRSYRKRTDDERIAQLQAQIDSLQRKVEKRERHDVPVLKEIPKVQKRLKRFAQTAVNYGREDLANSTMAFVAGLERMLNEPAPKRNES